MQKICVASAFNAQNSILFLAIIQIKQGFRGICKHILQEGLKHSEKWYTLLQIRKPSRFETKRIKRLVMDNTRAMLERQKAGINAKIAKLQKDLEELQMAESVLDKVARQEKDSRKVTIKDMLVEVLRERREAGGEGESLEGIEKTLQRRTDRTVKKSYLSVALADLKRKGEVRREGKNWSIVESSDGDE